MANSNELYEQIEELFEDFQSNHKVFSEKGNKSAGGRARKCIGEIKDYLGYKNNNFSVQNTK